MKTIEQLIFEKRFKDEEFEPNDFNDWAKENEGEAYRLCLQIAKELQQRNVSDSLPIDEVRFRATRFAHQCRLNAVITNKDTVDLYDKLYPPQNQNQNSATL